MTEREVSALPEFSRIPISVKRNRRLCEWVCEYPPTVASVSATALAFTTKSTKASSDGTSSSSSTVEQTIDLLIAKKIKNKILFTNRIETFEIITTNISGYTVDCDEDIIFKGACDTEDKFFWNGSNSTLFIDGCFEVRSPCITINGSRVITETDADQFIGTVFNYWDTTDSSKAKGFWGFDPTDLCFKYLLDVDVTGDCTNAKCTISNATPGKISTDTFVAVNVVNDSVIGGTNDLNFTSTTNIQVSATDAIDHDSTTYTVQTTTGTIISNTGTEGIDILSSDGDIDITSTNSNMNLTTTNDNMTINVDTGNMEICVDDGDLEICVNGSTAGQDLLIQTTDQSCIQMQSACNSSQAILINSTNGGIDINAGDTLTIDSPTVTWNSDNVVINVTDDFIVNGAEKPYKRWFPYKTFDVSCGYWQTRRDEISGCPVYFWRKIARAETAYITIDIDNVFRPTADKGFQLDKIYFSYEIEDEAITSLTPKLTLKTWDPNSPSTAVSVTTIPFTDGNLITSGLGIDEHYRYLDITTPDYLNTESIITIELELVTTASAVFKFYGAMIHYTFDAL